MAESEAQLQEGTLIARCQQGDVAAFDALINAHASRVYSLAFRMLGCQQDAEDAAQEAFVRAFSGLKNFRRGATFSTWLYRITTNVCLDELRRRRSRPQPFSSLHPIDDDADPAEDEMVATATEQDPGELITRYAQQQEVEAALASLPDHHRAVVILCDIDELSYEETAEILQTNVGTVKSRLHRARQRLRQLLSPQGELLANR